METYAGKLFWSAPLSRLMGIDADLFMATRVIVRRDDYDGEIYSSNIFHLLITVTDANALSRAKIRKT